MTIHPSKRAGLRAVFVLLLSAGSTFAQPEDKRPVIVKDLRQYRLDDEFSREEISDMTFSPDGQVLAYLKDRAKNAMPQQSLNPLWFMGGAVSDEIWLQTAPGQPARKITDSEKDGSRWWDLKWSPDGKRLAFLSTRGGNITLWIWERENDRIRQASTQGVVRQQEKGNFDWIDHHRTLFMAPIEGEATGVEESLVGLPVKAAERAWDLARSGNVSASVVRSGEFKYPERSLFLLDVETGKGKRIAKTVQRQQHISYPDFWPSPDGRYVALVSPVSSNYNTPATFKMGFPHTVELRTTDGVPVKLDKQLPENIHTQTIKWSPDAKELAFFANGSGPINPMLLYGVTTAEVMPQEELKAPMDNPAKLYRVNVLTKTIEQVPTGEIDLGYLGAPDFAWTASGELLFYAPKRQYGKTAGPEPSRGAPWGWSSANAPALVPQPPKVWLVLGRDGQSRPLSRSLPKIQGRFWSINSGSELLGISDGEIINVNPATGEIKNLTERFTPKVGSIFDAPRIADPSQLIRPNEFPRDVSRVIVTTQGGENNQYLLDLKTGESKTYARPATRASLSASSQRSGDVVYSIRNGLEGTFLWRTRPDGKTDQLVATNTYWENIDLSRRQVIEHAGLDGLKYWAVVTVPPHYKSGRRYPIVVDAYPGGISAPGPGPTVEGNRTEAPDLNTEYLTSGGGYVLVQPSIPPTLVGVVGGPPGHTSRGYEEASSCQYMTNTVIPAVEKLIEMGMGDPDRVFIQGHSWGGWTTLCIIGQTTRFKAAIAGASANFGDYEYEALWGGWRQRYSDSPARMAEPTVSYGSFTNVPWWRDGERLRRNNPITYADRIRTPLMLIHGDMDTVPIEFSEKFFNVLISMRKTVEFVRYWGEGHFIRNPANVGDELMRRFAWYDRWGDIARDEHGHMIWDGNRVKGRNGAAPLRSEDYAKFDFFQPSPARKAAEKVSPIQKD